VENNFLTVLYILNTKYPENIPNKNPIKYQLGSVVTCYKRILVAIRIINIHIYNGDA
jgi:hypothetical protein